MVQNQLKLCILSFLTSVYGHIAQRVEGHQSDELQSAEKKTEQTQHTHIPQQPFPNCELTTQISPPQSFFLQTEPTQMSEIKSVADMARVTTNIKVVNVKPPTKIHGERTAETRLPGWRLFSM